MSKVKHPQKRVTDFWWDFADNASAIIIESSSDKDPVVARFPLVAGASAEAIIEKATALVQDLKAGRITIKAARAL